MTLEAFAARLSQRLELLIGDLQSWDLDANGNVVDQAEYEKWCKATVNWSFGDSQSDRGADHGQ